ncbi:MAG TPA: protein kinase [Anaerolineales bacterium]|nr:protein kinase [Anaerolineales bacterium]
MPEWLGKTIGRVRIDKLLARGGMAEVYLGSHLTLDRPVAIKLLHSYIEEDPLLLERFQREAKVVAGLRHSNIVQIFDFDTTDGHPYIVMEYLKGPTLATYLRHMHQRKKRLPSHQVARLLKGLTAALDYAHAQGVIHRDVKPGNILLHNNTDDIPLDKPLTNDVEAVITDFGLVRIMNAATQTASGFISGTPAYMSPEQARGDQIDHRTDIYSLGVVLYEMLAGRVPFEADSTLTVLHMQIHTTPPPIPGIPAEVQAVIDRALLKNPADRYETSSQMAIDFYLSIGMNRQAETIREPYPVRAESIGPPAPPMPEPTQKEEPSPKPQPVIKSEPDAKPATEPKIEPLVKPQPKSEPTPQPARDRRGILPILLSVLGLAVLAIAGFLIFSRRANVPTPAAAVNTVIPNTIVPSSPEPLALPDSTKMVQVPAGTYQVGKDPANNNQSASQSISLPGFWIDQYQVTNQQFQQFVPEWSIPPGEENFPVVGVTWDQADAYCKSLNKRLPNEAEWEAAGRGSGENPPLYPWGTDPSASGNIFDLPNHTYEVGSKDFNISPLQVYDMLYNVYEWVAEPYGALEDGNHILRGARYGTPYDLAFRLQVPPNDTQNIQYAGFRCAADQVK